VKRQIALLLALLVASVASASWASGEAREHGEAEADAHEHGHHVPTWDEINWDKGFLGEKEGVEPSWMWRAPGTPVPMFAMFLNTAILFYLLGRFAGPALGKSLRKRKQDLTEGMQQAARMKEEAHERLDEYEAKLARVDDEIRAVKQQIRTAGEGERDRVLRDASARRARMEREARLLIDLELKAARELLLEEAARAAVKAAREAIVSQLGGADEQRIEEEYLEAIKGSKALGGRA
jgi:F-type H+-transporting ATPase subunit b